MQRWSESEIALQANLIKVTEQMKELFFKACLEDTIKNYQRISRTLAYYEKYLKVFKKGDKLQKLMNQCYKLVGWFVESSESSRFGHNFPLYGHLQKKLNNLKPDLPEPTKMQSRQSILGRIAQNEASPLYKQLKKKEITSLQLNFLKTNSIHQFTTLVDTKQIILQNPSCVSCSQVFIKDSILLNMNPVFENILVTMDTNNLDRLLNCIANGEGGVIIIGALNLENFLRPIGIKYKSYDQLNEIQSEISQAIAKLKPFCNYFIQKIQVRQNFLKNKTNQNQIRFCFRVFIFPQHKRLTYLELKTTSKTKYYDIYYLDQENNPVQIKFKTGKDGVHSFYTEIHQKYLKKFREKVNSHCGILCYAPSFDYSLLLNNSAPTQCELKENTKKQEEELPVLTKVFNDRPYFKYAFTSLLVVNTSKDDREIQNFYENLTEKKKEVELTKAFSSSFKCNVGDKSIWILSHGINHSSLKISLKVQEDKGLIKPVIKIMQVQKTVQVNRNKFSIVLQKNFNKKMKERYKQTYLINEIEHCDKNNEKKVVVLLSFGDFQQAIYAYLIFEEMKLKPYFTKQGKVYEKK